MVTSSWDHLSQKWPTLGIVLWLPKWKNEQVGILMKVRIESFLIQSLWYWSILVSQRERRWTEMMTKGAIDRWRKKKKTKSTKNQIKKETIGCSRRHRTISSLGRGVEGELFFCFLFFVFFGLVWFGLVWWRWNEKTKKEARHTHRHTHTHTHTHTHKWRVITRTTLSGVYRRRHRRRRPSTVMADLYLRYLLDLSPSWWYLSACSKKKKNKVCVSLMKCSVAAASFFFFKFFILFFVFFHISDATGVSRCFAGATFDPVDYLSLFFFVVVVIFHFF